MSGPRVALTGATGFLGRHLLPALLQAGFTLRILARRDAAYPEWDGLAFETVRGDLADPDSLMDLVRGAALVVHAAGLIKARSRAEFLAVNRNGTAALAAVTRRVAPQARFLLVSSLAAREPRLSDYAMSKCAAEQAAKAAFDGSPGQLAIIRPPVIYGPGDRETLTLFRSTLWPLTPVPGRGRVAMIHAADAAGAIAALAGDWHPGQYALADKRPEGYGMREILLTAAQATGGRPHLVSVPDAAVLAASSAAGLWARLNRQARLFGPGKAREIIHPDWTVSDAERLPAEIFVPRFGLSEGFADTVAWYRQAGCL